MNMAQKTTFDAACLIILFIPMLLSSRYFFVNINLRVMLYGIYEPFLERKKKFLACKNENGIQHVRYLMVTYSETTQLLLLILFACPYLLAHLSRYAHKVSL